MVTNLSSFFEAQKYEKSNKHTQMRNFFQHKTKKNALRFQNGKEIIPTFAADWFANRTY